MQDSAALEDDVIVREIDVYWCGGTLENTECPLLPPWRQYDAEGYTAVRWKPKAKKLEVEAPVDPKHPTFDPDAGPGRHMDKKVLTSAKVDLCTNFACGSIRNNKLLLTPIQGALQLRQSLSHCNADSKKAAAKEAAKKESGLVQMQVQVQKRENERQIAARKSSYAYLAAQEAEEPWKELKYEDENSDDATIIWETMMAVREGMKREVKMDSTRKEFLEAFVPGQSGRALAEQEAHRAQLAAMEQGVAGAQPGPSWAPAPSASVKVSAQARKELGGQLGALFHQHSVANLADIRAYLKAIRESATREYWDAPDALLHTDVLEQGQCMFLKKVYLQKSLDNPALNRVRSMVLELFKSKDTLRKADVVGAAKAQGVELIDQHYVKVMKSICDSKGGQWSLRTGAVGLS